MHLVAKDKAFTNGRRQSVLSCYIHTPSVADFQDPIMAHLCHGWHEYPPNFKLLLFGGSSERLGVDAGAEVEWTLEPHYAVVMEPSRIAPRRIQTLKIDGVFRSTQCQRSIVSLDGPTFNNFTCEPCRDLATNPKLRSRAATAAQPAHQNTASCLLNPTQRLVRLRECAAPS